MLCLLVSLSFDSLGGALRHWQACMACGPGIPSDCGCVSLEHVLLPLYMWPISLDSRLSSQQPMQCASFLSRIPLLVPFGHQSPSLAYLCSCTCPQCAPRGFSGVKPRNGQSQACRWSAHIWSAYRSTEGAGISSFIGFEGKYLLKPEGTQGCGCGVKWHVSELLVPNVHSSTTFFSIFLKLGSLW